MPKNVWTKTWKTRHKGWFLTKLTWTAGRIEETWEYDDSDPYYKDDPYYKENKEDEQRDTAYDMDLDKATDSPGEPGTKRKHKPAATNSPAEPVTKRPAGTAMNKGKRAEDP